MDAHAYAPTPAAVLMLAAARRVNGQSLRPASPKPKPTEAAP